jgi:hypothetical protein
MDCSEVPAATKVIRTREIQGSRPLSRVKASNCVVEDGKVFLFGGFDEDDKREHDP